MKTRRKKQLFFPLGSHELNKVSDLFVSCHALVHCQSRFNNMILLINVLRIILKEFKYKNDYNKKYNFLIFKILNTLLF